MLAEEEAPQRNGGLEEAEDEDAAGWDMGEDEALEAGEDFVNVEAADAGAGSSEAELWTRNSPIAADHVAGGSFETAMNLLSRQIGAINFKPLEPRFEEIYLASRTYLPANASLPPLINYVRRTLKEKSSSKLLPLIPRDMESIQTNEVQTGKQRMQKNQLEDGIQSFKNALYLTMVNAVSSQAQQEEVRIAHRIRNK